MVHRLEARGFLPLALLAFAPLLLFGKQSLLGLPLGTQSLLALRLLLQLCSALTLLLLLGQPFLLDLHQLGQRESHRGFRRSTVRVHGPSFLSAASAQPSVGSRRAERFLLTERGPRAAFQRYETRR